MIIYREIQATKKVFEKIECDRCGKVYGNEDALEVQEFHHVKF